MCSDPGDAGGFYRANMQAASRGGGWVGCPFFLMIHTYKRQEKGLIQATDRSIWTTINDLSYFFVGGDRDVTGMLRGKAPHIPHTYTRDEDGDGTQEKKPHAYL